MSGAKESSAVIELFARLINTMLSKFSGSFPIGNLNVKMSKSSFDIYISSSLICYQPFILFIYDANVFDTIAKSVELANFARDRWIASKFYLITLDCLPFHGTRFRGLLL